MLSSQEYQNVLYVTAREKYLYHKTMAQKLESILIDLKNHGYNNTDPNYHRIYARYKNHVRNRAMYHDKGAFILGVIDRA